MTQQQVQNTLKLTGVFSLINGAASLTDNSGWAALGVTSAAILLQINDPTTDLFYQNSGYLTANYGNPDLNAPTGTPTFSFTLPQDINGAYLQGNYQINCSIQLISAAGTQTFSVTVYENVCSCCNGVVVNVIPNINYLNAQVSVVDNTQYGNYQSVANTLTLYPPPPSGQTEQNQTFSGGPATLIWQPPSGQKTYTGGWQWTLSSVLTFVDQTTGATTTCLVTGNGTFSVNQNPVCKVLCFLNEYVTKVQVAQRNSITNAAAMERQLLQAQGYFALLLGQQECGNNGQFYVEQIYHLIGIMNPNDPNCNCGCGGTDITPLIPTQSINGTNGTNGLSFRQGSGVPAGSLGAVGDSYISNSGGTEGNIYLKTGATTWTFEFNILGTQGTPAILYNNFANVATPDTSLDTLDSFTIAAGQFASVEDEIDIEAVYIVNTNAGNPAGQFVQINVGGTLSVPVEIAPSIVRVKEVLKLIRTGASTITYILTVRTYTIGTAFNYILHQEYDVSGTFSATFSGTIAVLAQAQSVTTGDLTSNYLSGTYYPST